MRFRRPGVPDSEKLAGRRLSESSVAAWRCLFVTSLAVICACMAPDEASTVVTNANGYDQAQRAFTSAHAKLVDFTWDGEVVSESESGAEAIKQQAMFTVGSLNAYESVGRLERLAVTNVVSTRLADGMYAVSYHAVMPVAWNRDQATPATFLFRLPRLGTWTGVSAFANAYAASCAEAAGHAIDGGSMFYYYRPNVANCMIAPADIAKMLAVVSPSLENTTGKYPEYQRVWQDDFLKAVVVFGKYEEAATANNDPGIGGYNAFIASTRNKLRSLGATVTTSPSLLPSAPGASIPEVILSADLPFGKRTEIHVSLVSNVSTEGPAWDAYYAALTPDADVVLYNGHAGLGANVRNLLSKGSWKAGQYLLFFMNGCDTFAYLDGRLRAERAKLNLDDEDGTKYLDMVSNAMPSNALAYESESVLLDALLDWETPQSYPEMLANIDDYQVAVVTGEEDNEFVPGMKIGSQTPPPRVAMDAGAAPGSSRDSGAILPFPVPSKTDAAASSAPSVNASGLGGERALQPGCGCSQTRTEGRCSVALMGLALVLASRRKRR